ncbi:MAG: hypothetical protein LBB24_02255 [Rickettsiales bacterium]|nr:hypothetical protein [Rickettsiales bacterium]
MKNFYRTVLPILAISVSIAGKGQANIGELALKTLEKAVGGGVFSTSLYTSRRIPDADDPGEEEESLATKIRDSFISGATAGVISRAVSDIVTSPFKRVHPVPSIGTLSLESTENYGTTAPIGSIDEMTGSQAVQLIRTADLSRPIESPFSTMVVESMGGGGFIMTDSLMPRIRGTSSATDGAKNLSGRALVEEKFDDWFLHGAVPNSVAYVGATTANYLFEGLGKPTLAGTANFAQGAVEAAVEGAAYNAISNLLPSSDIFDPKPREYGWNLDTGKAISWRFTRGAICNGGAFLVKSAISRGFGLLVNGLFWSAKALSHSIFRARTAGILRRT